MVGKVALFGFLLTIEILFSTSFAIPLPDTTNLNKLGIFPNNAFRPPGTLGVMDYSFFELCSKPCEKTGKKPLCGTNGQDYTSLEELNCHVVCEKKEIGIKHYGKCKKSKSPGSKPKSSKSERQL